jgi:hypothetical protein
MSLVVISQKSWVYTRRRLKLQYVRSIYSQSHLEAATVHIIQLFPIWMLYLLITPFKMCTKRMRQYAGCQHLYQIDINRCPEYYRRNPNAYCVGSSGHMRDLPQDLDQQDQNFQGLCPACTKKTPPSSQGSMWRLSRGKTRDGAE